MLSPTLHQEIARQRQADMLRAAAKYNVGAQVPSNTLVTRANTLLRQATASRKVPRLRRHEAQPAV